MNATVVIDPGHGGTTAAGGSSPNNAVGPNGLLEKDVVLDIGRRVATLLGRRANVILTRHGDENQTLTARAAIAKDADADVFLSIHLNGWSDPALDGCEAWVAKQSNGGSHALARAVLDRVLAVTQARDRGVREEDFGVLLPARQGAHTAASLLEVAFLTNPDEAARLARDDYRQALAQAIADGIASRLPAPGTAAASALDAPPPDRIDGIDCHHSEALPSWADLRGDGVQFLIHKASEHGTFQDTEYIPRHVSARADNFLFGAYHFYRAGVDSTTQANNFIDVVQRLVPGDLPPSFDFETGDDSSDSLAASGLTKDQWLVPMTAFLDRVETALGRVPMIYVSWQDWHDFVQDDPALAWFDYYRLWVKQWHLPESTRYAKRLERQPKLPSPWKDWTIWQYSGDFTPTEYGNLHAVNQKMDANVTNGGVHVLRGLAELGRPAPVGHGDGDRIQFVFYVDENGGIHRAGLAGAGIGFEDITGTTGLRAAGDVVPYRLGGEWKLAIRGRADGHLYELEAGPVTDLTATVVNAGTGQDPFYLRPAGDPTYLALSHQTFDRALAYWGESGHWYLLVNRDDKWELPALDVTANAKLEPATGDPALYLDGDTIHTVGRAGLNGHLVDAWHEGIEWHSRDLTQESGGPAATYQPSTYVGSDGRARIVFRAAPQRVDENTTLRGHIHEIDHDLHDVDLTLRTGAPICAGAPLAFTFNGAAHIVYRRTDGLLHELYQAGGDWRNRDLGCTMRAAADPGVAVDEIDNAPGEAYVVYRGRDGAIYQAMLKADTWTCKWRNSAS